MLGSGFKLRKSRLIREILGKLSCLSIFLHLIRLKQVNTHSQSYTETKSRTESKRAGEIVALLQGQSHLSHAASYECLPGDAGNRSYARVQDQGRSTMLMLLSPQDAFKSEEASASHNESSELDFVVIARQWAQQGIGVPEIYHVDQQRHFVWLEDVGDELLYDRVVQAPDSQSVDLEAYKKALDQLIVIQKSTAQPPIQGRCFNKELLEWEFEHFMEFGLEKRGIHLPEGLAQDLRLLFSGYVSDISELAQVPVHRDYHSKNLILNPKGEIRVIDFQDALMGPWAYDVASLLRDSYVVFSSEQEEQLFNYYFHKMGKSASQKDWEDYLKVALHRNLKAIGRFYYIQMVKGRDTHVAYINPTLIRVKSALNELGRSDLADVLENAVLYDAS